MMSFLTARVSAALLAETFRSDLQDAATHTGSAEAQSIAERFDSASALINPTQGPTPAAAFRIKADKLGREERRLTRTLFA